jgi:hypothetical protein
VRVLGWNRPFFIHLSARASSWAFRNFDQKKAYEIGSDESSSTRGANRTRPLPPSSFTVRSRVSLRAGLAAIVTVCLFNACATQKISVTTAGSTTKPQVEELERAVLTGSTARAEAKEAMAPPPESLPPNARPIADGPVQPVSRNGLARNGTNVSKAISPMARAMSRSRCEFTSQVK